MWIWKVKIYSATLQHYCVKMQTKNINVTKSIEVWVTKTENSPYKASPFSECSNSEGGLVIGCSTTRPPRMFYRNKSYMHVKKSQLVKRQSYRNLKHSQAMALFPTKDISQIRQIYFRNIKIIEVNIIFLTKGFLIQINRNQTQTCLLKNSIIY